MSPKKKSPAGLLPARFLMINATLVAQQRRDNVPLAFLLVILAGLSTCLGAAVVFVPR